MNTYKVPGYYGDHNACDILVVELSDGSSWYAVEGGTNGNLTLEKILAGVNVETLEDIDCFQVAEPIESIQHFIELIES